jgi:hypothetical protein
VTNHPQKGHAHTHTHTHIPGHEELNRGYFTHFTTHTHTRSRTVEPQSIDTLHTLLHTLSHFNRGHACRRYFAHTLLHTLLQHTLLLQTLYYTHTHPDQFYRRYFTHFTTHTFTLYYIHTHTYEMSRTVEPIGNHTLLPSIQLLLCFTAALLLRYYTHIHTRCHEQWSPLEPIHYCRRYSYCYALLLLYYCVTTHHIPGHEQWSRGHFCRRCFQ